MITKSYTQSPYGQLHVRTAGEGSKRPLICLHMSPYSGDYYRNFQLEMASDRMVICPDTPGYGGSDAPTEKPSISDYADAMVMLVAHLGLDSVDVLGFHTGTFIATELALKLSQQVNKLVLPGIPYVDAEKREKMAAAYAKPRPYFDDADYMQSRWELAQKNLSAMSEERIMAQFAESLRPSPKAVNWGFEAVFAYDPDDRLPKLEQSVLIPVPDEALADNSRAASSLFKDATVVEWPDHSATLFETNAEEVASRVREFLDDKIS